MLLGIHIIARNEADVIGRCLASVKAFADEIVVADTGSTDHTMDVAREYGARVIQVEWQEDFARARNQALEQARTIWVLVLDADEWVASGPEAAGSLREELRYAESRAMRIQMEHELDSSGWSSVSHCANRLFRADRGYYYVGEIHEQLVRRKRTGELADVDGPLSQSGLLIRHDGYKPEVMDKKNKVSRNLRIMEGQLASRPDDPFCLYNYGVALCQLGQLEKASTAFRQSLHHVAEHAPFRATLIRDYAIVLLGLQKGDEATRLLTDELKRYPDYPDLHMYYGDALRIQGMPLRALASYEQAVSIVEHNGSYIMEAGSSSWLSYCKASETLLSLRLADRAQHLLERALSLRPGWERALGGLAEALYLQNVQDQEMEMKLQVLAGTGVDAELMVARCLTAVGASRSAYPLWRKLLSGGENLSLKIKDMAAAIHTFCSAGEHAEAESLLCAWLSQSNTVIDKETLLQITTELALYRWRSGASLTGACWLNQGCDLWIRAGMLAWGEVELLLLGSNDPQTDTGNWSDERLYELAAWVEQAVKCGVPELGYKLSAVNGRLGLLLERLLYDEGYDEAAAELMLRRFAEEGMLSAGHALRLGEMLYLKGMYTEALALFEREDDQIEHEQRVDAADSFLQQVELRWSEGQSMEERVRLELAAAATCLQMALQALKLAPGAGGGSPNWDGGWSEPDELRLAEAIREIESLGWQTVWNGKQRRRKSGESSEANFLMHDRQE